MLKERLEELRYCDCLTVSIDGIKSYQELRGGNFDDVVEGIVMARNAGIHVSINCVLNDKNLDEVDELVMYAENLGIGILFEPLHEYESIPDAVWEEVGIKDRDRYVRTIDRIMEMKKLENPQSTPFPT